MERGFKSEGLTREEDQGLIQKQDSYDHLDESEKENQGQALPYSAPISVPWAGTVNYPSFNNNTDNYSQAGFFQKAYGNIASLRLNRKAIQAKLKIGQPNDKYEQEADRVAEQVMRMPDRSCIECKEDERPGEKITRHTKEETNLLQRREIEEPLEEGDAIEEEEIPEEEGEEISEEGSLLRPKLISSEPYLIQRQLEDEGGGEGGEKEEEEEKINEPLEGSDEEEYIQSKLKIGKPGDVYEQEADRMAEQVMRMGDRVDEEGEIPQVFTKPVSGPIAPAIQRQEEEDEPSVFTKLAAGKMAPFIQRQVGEKGEEVRLKAQVNSPARAATNFSSQIKSLKGGGRPLSAATRAFFEPRFGADFNHVRVHTGGEAAATAEAINARAFTTGSDIVFGTGQYAPETAAGRKLVAHELTHVIQQENGLIASLSNGLKINKTENNGTSPMVQRQYCDQDLGVIVYPAFPNKPGYITETLYKGEKSKFMIDASKICNIDKWETTNKHKGSAPVLKWGVDWDLSGSTNKCMISFRATKPGDYFYSIYGYDNDINRNILVDYLVHYEVKEFVPSISQHQGRVIMRLNEERTIQFSIANADEAPENTEFSWHFEDKEYDNIQDLIKYSLEFTTKTDSTNTLILHTLEPGFSTLSITVFAYAYNIRQGGITIDIPLFTRFPVFEWSWGIRTPEGYEYIKGSITNQGKASIDVYENFFIYLKAKECGPLKPIMCRMYEYDILPITVSESYIDCVLNKYIDEYTYFSLFSIKEIPKKFKNKELTESVSFMGELPWMSDWVFLDSTIKIISISSLSKHSQHRSSSTAKPLFRPDDTPEQRIERILSVLSGEFGKQAYDAAQKKFIDNLKGNLSEEKFKQIKEIIKLARLEYEKNPQMAKGKFRKKLRKKLENLGVLSSSQITTIINFLFIGLVEGRLFFPHSYYLFEQKHPWIIKYLGPKSGGFDRTREPIIKDRLIEILERNEGNYKRAYKKDSTVIYVGRENSFRMIKIGGSRSWRNNNPGNVVSDKKKNKTEEWGEIGKNGNDAIFPDIQKGFACQIYRLKRAAETHKGWSLERTYYDYTDVRARITEYNFELINSINRLVRQFPSTSNTYKDLNYLKNMLNEQYIISANIKKDLIKAIRNEGKIRSLYNKLIKHQKIRNAIEEYKIPRIDYVLDAISNAKKIARMIDIPKRKKLSYLLKNVKNQPKFVKMAVVMMHLEGWKEGKVKLIAYLPNESPKGDYSAEQK